VRLIIFKILENNAFRRKLIFIWDQLPVHDFIKGMEQK
jgi:hypothetical protein